MSIEQVGLQLGIAGLIVAVGYKLAVLLINRWAAAEAQRTRALETSEAARTVALREGLASIAASIAEHSARDLAGHADIARGIARIDGKLDLVIAQYEHAGQSEDTGRRRTATGTPQFISVKKEK